MVKYMLFIEKELQIYFDYIDIQKEVCNRLNNHGSFMLKCCCNGK